MRLIDADEVVHIQLFDEEHEEYYTKQMTVKRMIFDYTEETEVPTVDAIPVRHGRWEDCSNGWMCSECGDEWSPTDAKMIFGFNYCPNCGARMVGGEW